VAAFLVLALGRWIKPVDDVALSVAAPFGAAISAISSGIGDTISGLTEGPRLQKENAVLRRQVGTLLNRNAALQQAAHDNRVFRRMLKFDNVNSHLDLVTSRVIGTDSNSAAPYILINRGARDGLSAGMTVVDGNGYFVGSISDTTTNASKVLLMLSPSNSIGATDLRSHASGLVEGQFAAQPRLKWVVASASLHTDDFVVTSGQLNLYPRNILIGQILNVQHRNDQLFQVAELRPAADFQNLELVQVVRNFVPSVPARLLTKH